MTFFVSARLAKNPVKINLNFAILAFRSIRIISNIYYEEKIQNYKKT